MVENKSAEWYNDNLCEAINIIVKASINELSFDKTIVCTVTDDSEKAFGKYTVTDGSTTFNAYSENDSYFVNAKVLVLIPNGDWGQQKRITGKYISEDTPIVYIKPTDNITDLTGNLMQMESTSLVANGKDSSNKPILFADLGSTSGLNLDATLYNRLCVKADFKTALGEYTITSGSYGIMIIINDNTNIPIKLSSNKDMFGQVYNYFDFVVQEQAYAIPEGIDIITSIKAYLYQDGDFQYKDNDSGTIEDYDKRGSIQVRGVNIYLGTDKKLDEGVNIYTNDSMMYAPTDKSLKRNIHLLWNYKDSNGVSVDIDNSNIYWYIDEKLDKSKTGRDITIDCKPSQTFTSVRAEVQRETELYKSNELRFENQLDKDSQVPLADIKLEIVNDENALGAYPYYNYDNNIINEAESNTIRKVKLTWSSSKGNIDASYWDGCTIEWSIPSDEATTMLRAVETKENDLFYFSYKIAKDYLDTRKDNTITCTITLAKDKDFNSDTQLVVTKSITFSQHPTDKNGNEKSPNQVVTDITDEKIGDPDDPQPGTVFESVTNKINDIVDEKIGIPEDVKADTVYAYINAQEYLTQEGTFKALTKNNTIQGIFKDASGNLYINGSYISTGILRSRNWDGKLTYHYKNEQNVEVTLGPWTIEEAESKVKTPDKYGHPSWTKGRWSLSATQGTYWNLNNGQLFAKQFELNALEDNGQTGLYLNNSPVDNGYYFSIGNPTENNFIQYGANGNLTIQSTNFILDAFDNTSQKGIYFNSNPNPTASNYWFVIGEGPTKQNRNNFIQMDGAGNFTIQTNSKFVLNAWKLSDANSKEYKGVYINSDGKNNPYFRAGSAKLNGDGTLSGKDLIEVTNNKVLIASSEFVLDAWNDNKGIYLNSNPKQHNGEWDQYFSIGDTNPASDGSWMQYSGGGDLKAKLNDFILKAFRDDDNKGIYFNSNPGKNNNEYWFIIGEGSENGGQNNFIQMDGNGNFTIQTNSKFVLNAWKPKIADSNVYQGVYLNSDGATAVDNDNNPLPYFRVGKATKQGNNLIATDLIELNKDRLLIAASNLIVDGWNATNGGIYLSSQALNGQTTGEYCLRLGDAKNNEIALFKDATTKQTKLSLKLEEFNLQAGTKGSGNHAILNSNPASNGYYLSIGNNNYYISFNKNGNLALKIKDITLNDLNTTNKSLAAAVNSKIDSEAASAIAKQQIDKALEDYVADEFVLTRENVFMALTDNGTQQGIYYSPSVDDTNAKLYINAEYIATGVLKNAGITITDNGFNGTGTYFDLDTGLFYSTNLNLIVDKLDSTDSADKTIILTSNPRDVSQGYYLYIGNKNSYMAYDTDGNLSVSGNIFATAGQIGGWIVGAMPDWLSNSDGEGNNEFIDAIYNTEYNVVDKRDYIVCMRAPGAHPNHLTYSVKRSRGTRAPNSNVPSYTHDQLEDVFFIRANGAIKATSGEIAGFSFTNAGFTSVSKTLSLNNTNDGDILVVGKDLGTITKGISFKSSLITFFYDDVEQELYGYYNVNFTKDELDNLKALYSFNGTTSIEATINWQTSTGIKIVFAGSDFQKYDGSTFKITFTYTKSYDSPFAFKVTSQNDIYLNDGSSKSLLERIVALESSSGGSSSGSGGGGSSVDLTEVNNKISALESNIGTRTSGHNTTDTLWSVIGTKPDAYKNTTLWSSVETAVTRAQAAQESATTAVNTANTANTQVRNMNLSVGTKPNNETNSLWTYMGVRPSGISGNVWSNINTLTSLVGTRTSNHGESDTLWSVIGKRPNSSYVTVWGCISSLFDRVANLESSLG